jgi:hypothetical protein
MKHYLVIALTGGACLWPRISHAGDCALTEAELPLTAHAEADDVVIADFNGDGKLDVAFPEMVGRNDLGRRQSGKVRVYLGSGDGKFAAPIDTAIPVDDLWRANAVAADFNGDGKLDLVLADGTQPAHGAQSYIVLFGKGTGAFAKPIVVKKAGISGFSNVRAADINGDKKADLVASATIGENGPTQIVMLPGTAGGLGKPVPIGFAGKRKLGFELAYRDKFVWELADLNGDGGTALVVTPAGIAAVDMDRPGDQGAGNYGACTVQIDRKARFVKPACTEADQHYAPEVVAVADFNGDHQLDLVTGPPQHSFLDSEHGFDVVLGVGHGKYDKTAEHVRVKGDDLHSFWGLGAGDVTGDHKPDIIAVGDGGSGTTVAVLAGDGDGTFPTTITTQIPYHANSNAALVRFGAFQGAGTLGLAIYAWEGPTTVVHVYSGRCRK